eukprot:TRINITY_DN7182_c0_g1_i1.p1 TRINITY_DN7182_c0_g1~~TRINITY_DN7182_c0_g1_i1.p1  ORF type:complete len:110 (-),score=11.30 TRINITY_DN7182_c0_g1_i1:31-327(-)
MTDLSVESWWKVRERLLAGDDQTCLDFYYNFRAGTIPYKFLDKATKLNIKCGMGLWDTEVDARKCYGGNGERPFWKNIFDISTMYNDFFNVDIAGLGE